MDAIGKKVGKFKVETVLATYVLDVRLNVAQDVFTILVPNCPGETVDAKQKQRNYESFSATTLEQVKASARDYLLSRDKTEFADVIEYEYVGASEDHGTCLGFLDNHVGLDFRVSRVSLARDRGGRPKLCVPVDIDDSGVVSAAIFDGQGCVPQAYDLGHRFPASVAFTVERWQKFRAIKAGIVKLHEDLYALLGQDGKAAEEKLDAVDVDSLLRASLRP